MYRGVVKTADLLGEEWIEKIGKAEPEEAESEYAHFGTLLKPVALKESIRLNGIKVRLERMLQSEEPEIYRNYLKQNNYRNLFVA